MPFLFEKNKDCTTTKQARGGMEKIVMDINGYIRSYKMVT